ncbi:hypothetical protein IWX46DRAFT_588272 [Phyllosticta citricarpa]|uniref:Uncharacterized protein n=1 Tax=Phyllosticta citricarpa TaxID=55181 RepID=A0ABR1MQ73_9PEZI
MVGLGAAALWLPIFKARLNGIFSLLALPSDFYFLSSPSQVAKFSMVLFISKQDVEQWETVSNGRVPVSEKRELQTIFPSENGTCVRVAHWDDSRDFSQYIIVRLRPWMTKNSPFRTYIGHSSNRHALSGYKKRKCHTSLRNWSFPSLSTECESCSTGTTKTGCRCSKGAIAVSWTLKPLRLKPTSVAACSRPTPSSGTSTTESSRCTWNSRTFGRIRRSF